MELSKKYDLSFTFLDIPFLLKVADKSAWRILFFIAQRVKNGGGGNRTRVQISWPGASTGLLGRGGCRETVAAPKASSPYFG